MPRSPASPSGRSRALAVLLAAGVAFACDGPTQPGRIRAIDVAAPSLELRPGYYMRVEADPLDAMGEVVSDVRVRWRSLTPATLDVTEDGLMLALVPGVGVARATAGQVHFDLRLDLVNPPIAQLRLNLDTLRLGTPGNAATLVAKAFDDIGNSIQGATLAWESTAPRIATVSAAGVVTPIAVGRSTVIVRGESRADTAEVLVDPVITASSPVILGVTPTLATPGATLVVTGSGFASTTAGNLVLIDGTAVSVTAASPTQLSLTLPPAGAFACQPTRPVMLQVGTAGGIGVAPVTLSVAPARALAVGQALTLASAAEVRCNELVPAAGRYLITIPNAARTYGTGTGAALTLRGEAVTAPGVAAVRTAQAPPAAMRDGFDARQWWGGRRDRDRARAHARLLEANAAIAARAAAPPAGLRDLAASPRANAALTVPTLGAIVPLRIPAIGGSVCADFTPIGARIVHVSDHFVLLEDTASVSDGAATVAGQMDADYAAIGAELESRGWPIAQAFGNPLVMDSRLDDNGRVMVVFTPRMNLRLGGAVLATVVTCDFFPRAQFAASNVGEFLYAQVPTSLGDAMVPGSRALWRYEIRETLVHELKHVTSYAERIVRGSVLEEGWLEEATARAAEELYARAAYNTVRFGNLGFGASLACELRANDPAYPACADAPRAMRPHLEALWTFLDAPTTYSPLGGEAGDFSYYGSAWALTRWLADNDAPSEAVFFTALSVNRQSGVANLEARSGRTWDEMLLEWSLAMVTDDRAGFTAQSPRVRFPSFDLRSLYEGLCEVAGACIGPSTSPYQRAWPVQPVPLQGGSFSAEFAGIAPAGFAVLELVVAPGTSAQVLELKGYRGAPLPTTARLGIIRVQ